MTNMNTFYILQSEYIYAPLAQALNQYGSMSNYSRDGFGLAVSLYLKVLCRAKKRLIFSAYYAIIV